MPGGVGGGGPGSPVLPYPDRQSGFSYAEIAEIMGISKQTVANHMSLALSDLRVMLRPFLPESAADAAASNDTVTTNNGEV